MAPRKAISPEEPAIFIPKVFFAPAPKFVFPASKLLKEYAAFMSEYPQKKIPFTTNCLFAERRLTSEEPLSASMLTRLPT